MGLSPWDTMIQGQGTANQMFPDPVPVVSTSTVQWRTSERLLQGYLISELENNAKMQCSNITANRYWVVDRLIALRLELKDCVAT